MSVFKEPEHPETIFRFLPKNLNSSIEIPHFSYMSKELSSYVPAPKTKTSYALDLGCGDTIYKANFEQIGYTYIGLDCSSPKATLQGDAHTLPFKDNSFEVIFTRSVFEHLHNPFMAANEVYRILKPNGLFIGSVAFLEPYHGHSFCHFSHYGLYNLLRSANFLVECISPNKNWDVLTAQSYMALFPKMPYIISQVLTAPLKMLHKTYWKLGCPLKSKDNSNLKRSLWTTGSHEFVSYKK